MITPESRIEQIIDRGRKEKATPHDINLAWLMLNSSYAHDHMLDLFKKQAMR